MNSVEVKFNLKPSSKICRVEEICGGWNST